MIIRITHSPDPQDTLPFSYDKDAFLDWYREVFEGKPEDALQDAFDVLRSAGYEVELLQTYAEMTADRLDEFLPQLSDDDDRFSQLIDTLAAVRHLCDRHDIDYYEVSDHSYERYCFDLKNDKANGAALTVNI